MSRYNRQHDIGHFQSWYGSDKVYYKNMVFELLMWPYCNKPTSGNIFWCDPIGYQ